VNQAATAQNINVAIDKNAITYSLAKKSFRDWRLQKARHLTTAPLYSPSSKTKIAFSYFSQYYFYLSLLAMVITLKTLIILPMLLLLKMIVQWLFLNKITKKLNEKDLLLGSVVYELILLFIYPIFHLAKLFNKPNKWTN
jgi:hypothetical protein